MPMPQRNRGMAVETIPVISYPNGRPALKNMENCIIFGDE
jgi:hypothetical protein